MQTKSQIAASKFDLRTRVGFITFAAALMLASASGLRAQTLSVLHTFTGGGDGAEPAAGLTIDQGGNFYGTTSSGGAGFGTVFKLAHSGSGWILSTLYIFQGPYDGAYPYARVVFGPDGALYGTTAGGYNGGSGTVFRLAPPTRRCASINCPWAETVLHSFTEYDGANPGYGDLVFDAAGNIYGTTTAGGANCYPYGDCGLVFELSRSGQSWTESVLYTFLLGAGGFAPYSGVVLDSAGNLYGTTVEGGSHGVGVVYELSPSASGWTETVLHDFGGLGDGSAPYGLMIDQQNNLYGTTSYGPGQGAGTVWEMQPSDGGWTFSTLADLYGFQGSYSAPSMDAAGNLYGTIAGGAGGYGSVFKLAPSGGSWTYTDLHDFDGFDGVTPIGSVAIDAHGNAYGTTFYAGGEVWKIAP